MIAVGVLVALLLSAPTAAPADSARYGDWRVTSGAGWRLASTTNEANTSIGVWCTSEYCVGFIETRNKCDEGGKAVMLLNSVAGSAHISATCRHAADKKAGSMLSVDNFDLLVAALEGGGVVGIAIPMESGAFNVLRFSTAGATPAIRQAMEARSQNRPREPSSHPASSYL